MPTQRLEETSAIKNLHGAPTSFLPTEEIILGTSPKKSCQSQLPLTDMGRMDVLTAFGRFGYKIGALQMA